MALKVVKAADGSLSAKFDSLDQGAKDLPISMVRQSGLKVALELGMLDAAYDGTLKADGSEMTGEWKQRGAALPLTFRRVDKVEAAAPRPQEPKKPYKAGGACLEGGRHATGTRVSIFRWWIVATRPRGYTAGYKLT